MNNIIYFVLIKIKYPVRIPMSQIQIVFENYFLYLDEYAYECTCADFV